jgi:hypothetical protein
MFDVKYNKYIKINISKNQSNPTIFQKGHSITLKNVQFFAIFNIFY